MRSIPYHEIATQAERLCKEANFFLNPDLARALDDALRTEPSPLGVEVLRTLQENARLAAAEQIPLCQDTGLALFFVDLGEDVRVEGGSLYDAIQEGARKGYQEGYLRNSVVSDPLKRTPGKDNTPAIIHVTLVPGDRIHLHMKVVSAGCENKSRMTILRPADGIEGVKAFILTVVKEAGPGACPPFTVGVGIGGDFEVAPLLAKRALLRLIGRRHLDPEVAALELSLLGEINALGIGPVGLGGATTAFDVFIETAPCHIASLPVAVNLACHSSRHREVEI
ncbi:MAG: fumarate hydratase [Nitrospirae bacterium]|nr:fumarate hydratase [Nitrospirota bacterium]